MPRLTRTGGAGLAAVLLAALVAGCMVKNTEAPPLSGPSELGLALSLSATPDILPQDGWSQASVGIDARGPDGRAARAVSMRIETVRGGIVADYGVLSSRQVVTDDSGKARVSYTAPAPGEPVDSNTVVTIRVTPVGSNYANTVSRDVQIRLTPPGVILPPNGAPVPEFTFSPAAPVALQDVFFDASATTDEGAPCPACTYSWLMGDGTSKSGMRVTHAYTGPGSFLVSLTVQDPGGRSASISKSVTVTAGIRPTALFTFSPTAPGVSQDIFFTAAGSTAAPGRRIVAYDWDFGSGRTATGVTTSKRYDTAGSYVVTLQVTDDTGQTGTTSQTVQVQAPAGGGAPVPEFTFSPTAPVSTQDIFFDGSATRDAGNPCTACSYAWTMGDGASKSGLRVTHAYSSPGAYVVTLAVTNSSGRTATTSRSITVTAGVRPTAAFTFSPTSPGIGQDVFFTAAASVAAPGRSIVSYTWDFGSGSPGSGVTVTRRYDTAGTYVVTLRVTDDIGLSATTSQTVQISPSPVVGISASLVASPTSPSAGQSVQFNAGGSRPSDGATLVEYRFNFGVAGVSEVVSATPITNFTFTRAGTYVVTLQIRDSLGRTATTSVSLTVN